MTADTDRPKSKRKASQDRRDGRIHALGLAYALDQKRFSDDEHLHLMPDAADTDDGPTAVGSEAMSFGQTLFAGLVGERPAVDATIDQRLQNWTLSRMAVVDRSILRLGCYELLYCAETPTKVIINEYIEIAKRYGSDGKTAKLVNGVLDRIAKDHRS